MSRREYGKAADILTAIDLPNGTKQIAMVQLGNCYLSMNMKAEARKAYTAAIESEKAWGGRLNAEVSTYLVTYAEFFRGVAFDAPFIGSSADDIVLYERLLGSQVPDKLKTELLPLPNPSAIRITKQ